MTADKEFVFVLMPFRDEFRDVYELAIKRAIEECDFGCLRADELFNASIIIEDVENSIRDALLVVADLSTRNPNVFYEVGYARALDKEVILLTQTRDDVPVDLQHRRYISYGTDARGIDELRKTLVRTLQSVAPRARRTENARQVQESAGGELSALREELQALKTAVLHPQDGEIGDNPMPVFHTARLNARKASCQSNLKQLGLAMMQLAQDEDDQFPDCATWCEAVLPYARNASLLRCPAAPDLAYGYAMNQALSGFHIALLEDPSRTPLLFDSSIGEANAAAGIEGLCNPPRHLSRNNIVFADGHVTSVKPDEAVDLIWTPQMPQRGR
jgi:prepilin-type processing-associated H-X9-DG protein